MYQNLSLAGIGTFQYPPSSFEPSKAESFISKIDEFANYKIRKLMADSLSIAFPF